MLDKKNANPTNILGNKKGILMRKTSIQDVRHFLSQYNIDLEKYDLEKFVKLLQIEPQIRNEPIKITIASYLQESNLIELLQKQSQDINFQNLLYSISEELSCVQLKRDEILFRINDTADNFYIILKGRVSVLKPTKKMKQSTFKNYYNFLINLVETQEAYLFKLNLKANSDIFFSSVEEFTLYQHIQKKMKLSETLYGASVTKENVISILNKEIDITSSNLNIYNLSEEALIAMKTQEPEKLLIYLRKVFEVSSDENDIFAKFNTLINCSAEQKNFAFYEYENFTELRTKQFFGDFALDAANKKRTATITACEETILGCIPGEAYNKYIQAEKIRYRTKDLLLLNNFIVFNHIKQIHFERNYFQDFAPCEFEKDQIIFKQGELLDKLSIIKSGSVDFFLNASLVDVNLLMKNLILKAKSKGIFTSAKANELMENLYDGLNVTNKSKTYFENLVKKKNFLLFTCYASEAPGIESLLLGIPFLFKGVVKSDRCKIFKLDFERMNYILKSYEECKKEYLDFVENKVDNILSRLFNIKKCLVSRYSIEYELQTKFDNMKIDDQLKKMESAVANQNNNNNNDDNKYNNNSNNFDVDMRKTFKDFGKTESTFLHKNKNKNDYSDNVKEIFDNDENLSNAATKKFNKEAIEQVIADIKPYKNFHRKKKPQPEKIKINFQGLSEKKQLTSNQNLIDFQSNKTKLGNQFNSNTNKDLFNIKKSNEIKNSLINSDEKVIENSFQIKDNINNLSIKNTNLNPLNEKSFSEKNPNCISINNGKRTPNKIETSTSKSKACKSQKGNRFMDRKISYLEFPINKIRSIKPVFKLNELINSNAKNNNKVLNEAENKSEEESKITEQQDNSNSIKNSTPKRKLDDSATREEINNNYQINNKNNNNKNSNNSQPLFSHSILNNNNDNNNNDNNNNNHEEKFKFTTDLSKQNFKTNNTNNNSFSNLFGELNKQNYQSKQKQNFFVAVKDFDLYPSTVQKHVVFNYTQNDYYKNMMKFKVRNDVNQLINAKNEKEMFKFLINSGSQQTNFMSANKKINDDENAAALENKTGCLFYNKTSKDSLLRKNFDLNGKRQSIELQLAPLAYGIKSDHQTNSNFNFKKNVLLNSADSLSNVKDMLGSSKKNEANNFINISKNKKESIKHLILSNYTERKLEDFELIEKHANNSKAFSTRRLSLEKLSNNLNAHKHFSLINSNLSINERNYIMFPNEMPENKNYQNSKNILININNKFTNKNSLKNSKNRSQETSPDKLVFYSTNTTPFIKKDRNPNCKLNNNNNKHNSLTNTNSVKKKNFVGYLSILKDNETRKKANTNNNFFKKQNEIERDCMRETNYFDKHSIFNSTSNGFSVSEKNFRTTLESYLPGKSKNYYNPLHDEAHVQVTKEDLPEQNNSNHYDSYEEKENYKIKKGFNPAASLNREIKLRNRSLEEQEKTVYDKENDQQQQIVISEEFSKENEHIKSVNGKNKHRNSLTNNVVNNNNSNNYFYNNNNNYCNKNNFNAVNNSELKCIAQQTNENETEVLNEKNSFFFNDRSIKQNCLFSSEDFKKNKIHYKNYNEEVTLPLYKDIEKNNVKKIRELRSQLILKMTKKGLKNK